MTPPNRPGLDAIIIFPPAESAIAYWWERGFVIVEERWFKEDGEVIKETRDMGGNILWREVVK